MKVEFGLRTLLSCSIILTFLKIVGCITWSWWLILAPIWIPIAGLLAISAFIVFCFIIAFIINCIRW
jgi:hypothetical protein